MPTIIFAILILAFFIIELTLTTNNVKQNAYQWWHTPWFALLYTIVIYLVFYFFDLADSELLNWLEDNYKAEAFYCLLGLVVWLPFQFILRRPAVHNSLIDLYRKIFAQNEEEKNNKLPFPYYYSPTDNTLKSRVGRVFYQLTLKYTILIVAIIYAIAFIIAHFYPNIFFPFSAFGILGLLPLLEYFIYLSAEVEEEQIFETDEGATEERSDFDDLWQTFVDTFDNYSVAWKRSSTNSNSNIKDSFEDLFNKFKDQKRGGVIEDCDLVTAFSELVPFFMHTIKEGRYILVAFDIPKHFSTSRQNSYIGEIANKLTSMLIKRYPMINEITKFIVYDEKSTLKVFNNSIVMAPLPLITRQDMHDKEWMRNLGLITVVNVFDKGVSNLYENRKFGYILQSVNTDYQIIVVSAFRKELEPSLEKTWLTKEAKSLPECKINPCPSGEKQYFIGYNFEEWRYRYNQVLSAWPSDTLYSGSEMMVFPLCSRIRGREKTITPVHQVELAYTDALEGNEELRNFHNYFDSKTYQMNPNSVNKKVTPHVLPVDEILEAQTLLIIYDNENNSAATYMKWIHIGKEENFSIVISKPYLFRDYFNANHDYFTRFPFTALQPRMCKSRITLAIILLSLLKESKQEESVIKGYLDKYYDNTEIYSVPEKLKELFSTYFSDDLANDIRTSEEVVFNGKEYRRQVMFELIHPDRVHQPYLDIITVKDGNGNILFDIPRDLLYQNYNIGQHHSFSGWPYLIESFDNQNKTLNVNRSDEITNILFYKPCYSIEVVLKSDTPIIKDMGKKGPSIYHHQSGEELAYKLTGFETNITIKTKQWVTFKEKYSAPYFSAGTSTIEPTNSTDTPPRAYNHGKILKLSLRYLPKYKNDINNVRKMLHLLIYEGLQSLFPHHAQYLIIATKGEGDADLPWIFNDFNCTDETQDGWLDFYFIEDAHIDLGLIAALTDENIWYLMGYIFDYLLWLQEDPITPDGYDAYLNRKIDDKTSFLKYGNTALPDYFNIELAIEFIRDHFTGKDLMQTQQKRRSISNSPNSSNSACDFCGKEMKMSNMQRLEDGRMRCNRCAEGAIDTEEAFLAVYQKVVEAFKTHLGIDFSLIPHTTHLVSAVELHQLGGFSFSLTNGYDARKIIGFAKDSNIVDPIYVENGYSADKTFGIIAHELTHIWQYNNEEFQMVSSNSEVWMEGLAVWTDLYLSEKNGAPNIENLRNAWLAQPDIYGRGLNMIMNTCPDNPYQYIHDQAQIL